MEKFSECLGPLNRLRLLSCRLEHDGQADFFSYGIIGQEVRLPRLEELEVFFVDISEAAIFRLIRHTFMFRTNLKSFVMGTKAFWTCRLESGLLNSRGQLSFAGSS
ncbi:hypothetical protein BGX23_004516 [Mortierella sp. AD031]|nr:hypothetical protein BGX23_004516 [Mortierella sp. AD031]KAG0211118.1 hypothetical protein BGX33_004506 [Mortierella sp. NVP41]